MEYKDVKKKDFSGKTVKVLDESYDSGVPEIKGAGVDPGWRKNMHTIEDKMKYLTTGERYWYSKEWFGSEKRK